MASLNLRQTRDGILCLAQQLEEQLRRYEEHFAKLGFKPLDQCGISDKVKMANFVLSILEKETK